MTERRKEVGACGNNCAACLDYRVLTEDRDDLRRQVASAIKREMNLDIPLDQVGCDGCWGGIHTAWAASLDCKIRQCVEARNYTTCADCPDFTCATYLKQFLENSDQAKNINAIKQVGMDKWIAQQAASGYRPPAAGSA
ncbi:MAG: DUF3795 domain-containing protein [Kiritimatiellaeota bacterium]|nr:DUF3795 domain-containing protein [Kiritimatiellota bacterium]